MQAPGWRIDAVGSIQRVIEFNLPPFGQGVDRSVGRTVSGFVGLPFLAFEYAASGETWQITSVPLPCPLPPVVLHRGLTVRAGVADWASTHGDIDIRCDYPELAKTLAHPSILNHLERWGDGPLHPQFDLAFDGHHLVAVDTPHTTDRRFGAFLDSLTELAGLIADMPIRPFSQRPPPPRLGFRNRPWALADYDPRPLPRLFRPWLGPGVDGRRVATNVITGRVAGLAFTATDLRLRRAPPADSGVGVLVVHPRNGVPPLSIGSSSSGPGVRTGLRAFDERFRIECSHPEFARDLLALATLQRLIDDPLGASLRCSRAGIGVQLEKPYEEETVAAGLDFLRSVLHRAAPSVQAYLGVR